MCDRPTKWWDNKIKANIEQRRELYKKILSCEDELWEE